MTKILILAVWLDGAIFGGTAVYFIMNGHPFIGSSIFALGALISFYSASKIRRILPFFRS